LQKGSQQCVIIVLFSVGEKKPQLLIVIIMVFSFSSVGLVVFVFVLL
jgi:hypothetical protein